jgi:hypothetical protein
MRRRSLPLLCVLAVAGLAVAIDAFGADPPTARPIDYSLKPCNEQFQTYSLGKSFQGLPLTHHVRVCSRPDPTRTQAAGGEVDPDSLGRPNYESYVYGTCEATSDMGCAPPLEIQTWPACERSAADYDFGPPGQAARLEPVETTRLRGVPARFYDDVSLELSAGNVTVVVFAYTRPQLLAAAAALRGVAPAVKSAKDDLPAPAAGAQDGTLAC